MTDSACFGGGEERSVSFISREELPEHLETFVKTPVDEHGVARRATPCPLWMPQVIIIALVPNLSRT